MALTANYVKFLRGTPNAFAALESKDKDTLYFISETDSSIGKLYLGNIQVSGYITSDGVNVIDTLGELTDVDLSGIKDKQILVYDANSEKWLPADLPQAISNSVMIGATAEKAGTAGLVPAPGAGDQDKFLKGDGSWAEVAGGDLSDYATKEELEAASMGMMWGQLEETE